MSIIVQAHTMTREVAKLLTHDSAHDWSTFLLTAAYMRNQGSYPFRLTQDLPVLLPYTLAHSCLWVHAQDLTLGFAFWLQ